jgi:hypothetical protein
MKIIRVPCFHLSSFATWIWICDRLKVALVGLGICTSADIFDAAQKEYKQARVDTTVKGKRKYTRNIDKAGSKRARTMVRREMSNDEQIEEVASVLRSLEEEFAEKERLSDGQA